MLVMLHLSIFKNTVVQRSSEYMFKETSLLKKKAVRRSFEYKNF